MKARLTKLVFTQEDGKEIQLSKDTEGDLSFDFGDHTESCSEDLFVWIQIVNSQVLTDEQKQAMRIILGLL